MNQSKRFAVIVIPLGRPEIVEFLSRRSTTPRGVPLEVVGQRPTGRAESAWVARLLASTNPTVAQLLEIDHPHGHLVQTWTDRLVPVEFLDEPEFLTRNLGGWAALYFGVAGLPASDADDPLLREAQVLTEYGPAIHFFGADPDQVAARLEQETGAGVDELVAALGRLHALRRQMAGKRKAYVERIYAALVGEDPLDADDGARFPEILLFDELLGQLVRLELTRREALANGDQAQAASIEAQQLAWQREYGLRLFLKGEYIVGRHRRSTILIAPELGVVVKQPAPETFHEIQLQAKVVDGRAENWPRPIGDGALVTARGRLRLTAEEDLVVPLARALDHRIRLSTLLGLTIEDFVAGQTTQQLVWDDPGRMTAALYEEYILHQQVCELLGGENGDWHSANFVVRHGDGAIIHVDWGAARPLRDQELTPAGERARLNQVQNLAYSFHDDDLARLVLRLHAELMADAPRLARVQRRAQALVDAAT